jgi:hypothetical protein
VPQPTTPLRTPPPPTHTHTLCATANYALECSSSTTDVKQGCWKTNTIHFQDKLVPENLDIKMFKIWNFWKCFVLKLMNPLLLRKCTWTFLCNSEVIMLCLLCSITICAAAFWKCVIKRHFIADTHIHTDHHPKYSKTSSLHVQPLSCKRLLVCICCQFYANWVFFSHNTHIIFYLDYINIPPVKILIKEIFVEWYVSYTFTMWTKDNQHIQQLIPYQNVLMT